MSQALQAGGVATAAEMGVYDTDGQDWLIEGWGVEPDLGVDNEPLATFRGEDAQLVAGVRHLQRMIAEAPVTTPPPPPYPIKAPKSTLAKY